MEELYDKLFAAGDYTKSFEEFKSQYGDVEKSEKLYSKLNSFGDYTKSFEEFKSQYGFNDDSQEEIVEDVVEDVVAYERELISDIEGNKDPEKKNPIGLGLPSQSETENVSSESYQDPFTGTILADKPEDPFEVGLSTIDNKLIDKEEEFVVPDLNYRFNDYGFTFDKSGFLSDAMVVTAANGEKLSVDLDPVMGDAFGSESAEARKLRKFLEKNKVDSENNLARTAAKIENKNQQLRNEKEIQATVKLFNEQTENFRKEVVEFSKARAELDREYEDMFKGLSASELKNNPEVNASYKQYVQRKKELMGVFGELQNKEQTFSYKGEILDQEVGRYVEMQSEQGSWSGGIWNAMNKGASSFSTTFTDIMTDFFVEVNPMGAGYNEAGFQSDVTNDALRRFIESPEKFKFQGKGERSLIEGEVAFSGTLTIENLLNKNELTEKEKNTLGKAMSNFSAEEAQLILSNLTAEDGTNLVESSVSRTKDAYKKATKYYGREAYDRFRKTGNVRPAANPFSMQSNYVDTEMGMIDATRKGMVELLGSESTTDQWANLQKQDFWGGAFLGLAESLPAMIGSSGLPGVIQRTAQMYALTSSHIDEEMSKDPAFDNITENQKYFVKAPVGIAVGVLEAYGFRNIVNSKGLINSVVARAIGKSTEKTTAKTFQEFIRQDVKSMIGRGVLTVGAGGAAEFETGFLQEGATIGIKEIFDAAQGKDLFQNPDTFIDIGAQMLYAGAQEAVGGFTLGVIPAVSNMAAGGKLAEVDDAVFKIFEGIISDPEYKTMYVTKLKQEVAAGTKTQKEADKELKNFEKLEGLAPQIPVDYNTQQRKDALQLLLEKQDLTSKIEGKAPELVKKEQTRIKEINQALEGIQTKASETLQSQNELEQSIPELGVQEQVEEKVEEDTDVTQDERTDIEGFFGEEIETETTSQNNLFFNRKGKRTNELTPDLKSMRGMVIDIASKAANSIKKILPKTKIVIHESIEEFNKVAPEGRGFFDFDNNTIHINLEGATATTVPHEVFHAVLFNTLGETKTAEAVTKMIGSVRKTLDKNSLMANRMDAFERAYQSEGMSIANEEALSELFGMMASDFKSLTKPSKNAIVNFIKNMASKVGIDLGSKFTKTDRDIIDLLNTLARKTRTGEEIEQSDIATLEELDNGTNPIGNPTTIVKPKSKGRQQKIKFKDSYPLSLVSSAKKIDIDSLIDTIADKGEKVWFWVADQLGLDAEMDIDAGPSYALQTEGEIWASSLTKKSLERNIDKAEYIFIISGSPSKSHLFNKKVYDKYIEKLGDYATFKKKALETNPVKGVRDVLTEFDSWQEVKEADGSVRKNFLIAHIAQSKTPNTAYHKLVKGMDGFIDPEIFRDGFYAENNFQQNDIMMVLKPTGVKEGSNHSTYTNTILGEVVGVPDTKIDAFELMPQEMRDSMEGKARTNTSQKVAPYGSGVKEVTSRKGRQQKSIEQIGSFFNMNDSGFMPSVINTSEIKRMLPPSVILKRARSGSYYLSGPRGKINPFSPRGRQQKDIADIINESRDSNFRDEVIKDFLVRVKKYPVKLVNQIMNINVDLFKTLPKSFANITDGLPAGVKLYKKVKAYEQKLIIENKDKKVKLTEQQIADQTIEFLKKQTAYKNEGDGSKSLTTKQAQLQVEFQKSVGTRPSESVQEKLTEARRMLQQRKRGAKDLQSVKVAMRNFLRKSLPADVYTRSEVMKLVRQITDAGSTAQIENLFNEIIEFVNTKNNVRLQKKIDSILNGKYETKQSGRNKAAKISLKIKERIQKIAKDVLSSTATAEEIENTNKNLTDEFNQIRQKNVLSEGDMSRLEDIQILLNLNNSLTMENNDVNKTGSLDVALASLTEMIEQGRSELKQQLQDKHNQYNDEASIAIEEITGEKVDMGDPDAKVDVDSMNQKLRNKKQKTTKRVIAKFVNTLKTNVKKFFNETEALDGLMDLISKLPGEMFGGRLQDLVTSRVDASTRMYKGRMMQQEEILATKLEELYGKKWRKQVRTHNQPQVAYVLDTKAIAKAKEDFNNDPSLKNKQILKEVLAENEVEMSQNEMLYYYNLYKDPANRGSFKATFGNDFARIMNEMEANMDNSIKEFGDWQVNEFYPSLYSHYNATYKALYRTNMPWNRYYSGMIYRNDPQGNPIEQQPLDLLADKSIMNTSVGTASTKSRVQNNFPIRKMNSMNVMATYLRDMEYFAAYGETINSINKIFSNKQVRESIGAIHGDYVNRLISNMISKIANQGIRSNSADRFVNKMNNLFIFSRIGLNPTVMIKQLTSMITYGNDIGYANWLKYSLKNIPQIKNTFKEISKNSVYMQDRNKQSITRIIESYSNDGMIEMVPNEYWDSYVNFIMYTTKFGDKAAIYLGGMPNYLYYKDQALKQGKSEQEAQKEAIIKFERDTKRTQQSMDLQDRDFYQTAGALQRGLNMFLTTPKQYLRKEIQSTRNLYRKLKAWDRNAGKGTLGENIRTFVTYHLVAPVLFQYVALGLPGLLRPVRDEDDDDLLRAAIIGNLNALFIIGEVISGTADLLQDKSYAGESVRSIAPLMQLQRLLKLANRAMGTKDEEKAREAYKKFYLEIAASTSLPAIQIDRFIKNIDKLGKGDTPEDVLRILNFSPYVIEGPKKKKSSTKTKSIAEQNAEYYKEQERKKRQTNNLNNSDSPLFRPIK
tara:strand:- start:12561 stop:20540 length:7980 start_codon:yes stop_codon:yes gene_type:complete